jgi:hypothetical protein
LQAWGGFAPHPVLHTLSAGTGSMVTESLKSTIFCSRIGTDMLG